MSLWNKLFTPMLLSEINKPFDNKEYLFELKYDGMRCIIYVNKTSIKIISRNKNDVTYLFPELKELCNIVTKNVIFDGEIISMSNNKPSFSKLQERMYLKDNSKIKYQSINNPVTFIAFDILYENKDLIHEPLYKRKEILSKYQDNNIFVKSFYIDNFGIKLFNKVKKLDIEGIVAKKKDTTYKINTRSNDWIKIKNYKEEEFIIGGYKENKSNYVITIVLGEIRDNKLYYVGNVILNKKSNLYKNIINCKQINNPFIDYKDKCIFIEPILKVNISYIERTLNNHLRCPVVKIST